MNRKKAASGFSLGLIGIFLAIVIVLNILFGLIPEHITQLDISASRLYSVSSNTKSVISALDDDVTIYWITQAGEEDDVIEKLLEKYDALSSHVTVEKKDPDVYPTFAQQYTDGTVYNNDLIVESGDIYRYISLSDIYESDNTDYYTGSYDYYFDGEGEITSAINYVTSDEHSKLYRLTGHGEQALTSKFSSEIEKNNIIIEDLALPSLDEIPSDCDGIIIYSPTTDISEPELDMLTAYVSGGGKLLVFVGPQETETLDNLHQLLENYGITSAEGVIIETDRNYYGFGMPYVLYPTIFEDDITTEIIEEGRYVIVPLAEGLVNSGENNGATVTSLIASSDNSVCKADGFALTTYDVEEQDTVSSFDLALKIEDGSGEMIWVSSSYMLDDTYNSYSSGANLDFSMNCISDMLGESENMAIRSKSLNYEYLTISESAASFLKLVMIVLVPVVFVAFGVVEIIQRRRLR